MTYNVTAIIIDGKFNQVFRGTYYCPEKVNPTELKKNIIRVS